MLDAVFISDLHLHPQDIDILNRFDSFIHWAKTNTRRVYILGDFFHVWGGDDGLDVWSLKIASQLRELTHHDIELFFLPGNRDFLVGKKFASLAGFKLIPEPSIIQLDKPTLLVHGDRYCRKDTGHVWLRRFTRNRWFPFIFSKLPLKVRQNIVSQVRAHSQNSRKESVKMEVVVSFMLQELLKYQVIRVIHGHTHKPGLINYWYNKNNYEHFVLSDWDTNPAVLCYDEFNGLIFKNPL